MRTPGGTHRNLDYQATINSHRTILSVRVVGGWTP